MRTKYGLMLTHAVDYDVIYTVLCLKIMVWDKEPLLQLKTSRSICEYTQYSCCRVLLIWYIDVI